MSRSLKKVMLIGNVGADPDVHQTQGGKKVASISLATSRRVPRGDDVEERTDWHRPVLWERLAEIVEEYVRKGDRLFLEGRIEYDSYQREDGTTVPTTRIVVRELIMLGSPGQSLASPRRRS